MEIAPEEIMKLQSRSEAIKTLRERVRNGQQIEKTDLLKEFYRYREDFAINQGILVRKLGTNYYSAVVGFRQLVHVSVTIHRNLAHIGRDKLLDAVVKYVCCLLYTSPSPRDS